MKTKKYIIRGDRSGVFYGEISERNGLEVTIKNCRRLWYWDGAASLSELALTGTKKPRECKFTVTVPSLQILDGIEIIPVSETAQASIDGVSVWTA
jgi:hypothetical protein